ncbi:MAG TPA: hypothetical protein VFL13_05990 [Candidatus Baltobacteraceae bacterium]|nr:hypothetical protein [Candidatus Baltobacteraceae bacterium]
MSAALLLTACGSQSATPALHASSLAKQQVRTAAAKASDDATLSASPSSLHFDTPADAAQTVTIVISNPPLTVSADSSIATVSFEHGHTVHTGTDGDDRYVTLTITPTGYGYTTVTVTDKHSGTIEIPVQVGGGHAME